AVPRLGTDRVRRGTRTGGRVPVDRVEARRRRGHPVRVDQRARPRVRHRRAHPRYPRRAQHDRREPGRAPAGPDGTAARLVVGRRARLGAGTGWLALVVALNAVLGLAYYLRAAAPLFGPAPGARPAGRTPWPVAAALAGAALVAVVVGFAPQLVLAAAAR